MFKISERGYQALKVMAVLAVLAPLAYWAYDEGVAPDRGPGDVEAIAGDRAFQDRRYERALDEYKAALEKDPGHGNALLGKANTYVQLERFEDAVAAYNRYEQEVDPEFAGLYANRGIAYDRMGEHERALADYRMAQELDPSVDDGPGWLTRFFHIGPEPPPTVGDRADYLEYQLQLPPHERKLADPEADREQRPYTQQAQ